MRYFIVTLLFFFTACSHIPAGSKFDNGAPESLLDVSSEVVNMSLTSAASLDELAAWIQQDQPTRAELYCMEGHGLCQDAQDIFDLYGVPTLFIAAADNSAVLVYERVLARDCENRYINNNVNPYHLNHPTFGCSIAGNMVQMVSDKQQFVSPNLMDYPDAKKAVQNYRLYQQAPEREGRRGLDESLTDSIDFE